VEANLIIDLARAKRDIIRAQKTLAECIVRESEVVTSLMKLRIGNIEQKLDDVDVGLGHMHVTLKERGLS